MLAVMASDGGVTALQHAAQEASYAYERSFGRFHHEHWVLGMPRAAMRSGSAEFCGKILQSLQMRASQWRVVGRDSPALSRFAESSRSRCRPRTRRSGCEGCIGLSRVDRRTIVAESDLCRTATLRVLWSLSTCISRGPGTSSHGPGTSTACRALQRRRRPSLARRMRAPR